MSSLSPCKSCGSRNTTIFYESTHIPVHSVLLMKTREEARSYPRGDVKLAFCKDCGFIYNAAFDPSLHEYSEDYEETQGFSGTFNRFQRNLAETLIEKYGIRNKRVIEIGCGKGEFISLLCELGDNDGVGFDPAYIDERNQNPAKERIEFITDFYSEKYAHIKGDFTCCKMTLEHIPDVGDFIGMVGRSLAGQRDNIVFFQIPNMRYVLRDCAYWDIYYEHCSYFSAGSLGRLFRKSGFEVLDLYTGYDDQYLMIEARPGENAQPHEKEESPETLQEEVTQFVETVTRRLAEWRTRIREFKEQDKRVVFWGAGSKCVAFVSALGIGDEIPYAVDINPFKHNTFLPGSGHEIVSPDKLREFRPDCVILMNPVYREEVSKDLEKMGLHPEILDV